MIFKRDDPLARPSQSLASYSLISMSPLPVGGVLLNAL